MNCLPFEFLFQISNLEPQKIYLNKGERWAKKIVLALVLWIVVKEVLCSCNPLVSFNLWLLNCHTQLASSGCQDFERRRWVCLIFDLTLLSLVFVSSHEYFIFLDTAFFMRKIVEKETCKKKVRISEELLDRKISETQNNLI